MVADDGDGDNVITLVAEKNGGAGESQTTKFDVTATFVDGILTVTADASNGTQNASGNHYWAITVKQMSEIEGIPSSKIVYDEKLISGLISGNTNGHDVQTIENIPEISGDYTITATLMVEYAGMHISLGSFFIE